MQDWERFHWHLGRKLVLRTSAELGLSMWSAKMIVGKSIPSSDSTYLHGTDLKEDFMKLSKVLTLKPSNGNGKVTKLEEVVNSLEKENAISKIRIDLLQKTQTEQQKQIEEMRIEYKELYAKKLSDIGEFYPMHVIRSLTDPKTGLTEEWEETWNSPEESLKSSELYMDKRRRLGIPDRDDNPRK